MTDNNELHVVFGSGPVGMTVMDELASRGKRVRMVNRGGRANVPEGVEVVGGDATDPAFTREVSVEASTSYNALNPPYNKWPKLFPPLQASVLEGAAAAGAKLVTMENLYMYGPTGGQPLIEDLPHAANTRKGDVRARMTEELFAAHESGKVRARIRSAHGLRHHRCSPSGPSSPLFVSGGDTRPSPEGLCFACATGPLLRPGSLCPSSPRTLPPRTAGCCG